MTRPAEPGHETAWTTADPAAYPELPYPGARPLGSWRLTSTGQLHALEQLDGEHVCDLATGEEQSLTGRVFILAYGSNANPQKLHDYFAGEDVLALAADVDEWAAVWCSTRRSRDHVVVCTLVPVTGARERHVVLAVTPDQRDEMDRIEGHPRCAGHPGYYQRTRFTGHLSLNDGSSPPVEVYLGTRDRRPPLLVNGRPLRCSEVPYAEVDQQVPRRS